ncbi:transcription initiation factor TFIIF subunit alpha [Cryptococcus wingfieldii CBS 7118]|uniref:Transcription initiation factor IIF subunit alpha n=1 Tax=Cryptococcus wingfieldii CBS 7118 TaxID=1295528 RepID=A0A1E3K2Y4_9TREE|nr:transcription initiation factor TFIIF subunit alpha [Cryptococcus wingfieldii CBS 7118]ODO07389.1 transcription initiation factor TFIIF subunit alpha [Cryptococcus wingfieldii CBS 7118]
MSDATLFLRKNKDKQRRRNASGVNRVASSSSVPGLASRPKPSSLPASSSAASSPSVKPDPTPDVKPDITEIRIMSTSPNNPLRFNLMRLNHSKTIDPADITQPILMNRKKPGPPEPPIYSLDAEGRINGRYLYDEAGKPVLDEDGKHMVDKKETIDMSLVGQAPSDASGSKRKRTKRGTKEVFHQDIDIMRLRREEALPWVLESANPQERPPQPEQWTGRMVEQGALGQVLLFNDGTGDGFELIPAGRTYKFEPERPFKPLDADAANKLFELQAKHKIHDRWALRPADGASGSAPAPTKVKAEHKELENRAQRLESRIQLLRGSTVDRKPKVEKYEDDFKREGHRVGGSNLEGGVGEELDFDEAEEFQDDDDNNTFYNDAREQEEARELEERLKKEFRLANANVGDRPQIANDDEDEDDLFGDNNLDDEGKKLRKIMRKRMRENGEDYDMDEDSDSDSDDESVEEKKEEKKEKEKETEAPKTSSEPSSRPTSRPPTARTASPSSNSNAHRFPSPKKGKASTAPPGSGASLLAQRAASRGASPRPGSHGSAAGQATSPLGRASSPGSGSSPGSRATSPVVRGSSPASGANTGRGGSPASGSASREASPASTSGPQPKRNPSPTKNPSAPGTPSKRKSSPGASDSRPKPPKKSKKSSSTTPVPQPTDIPPFPGMITKEDVLSWFRGNQKQAIPMNEAIGAFRKRIVGAGPNRDANQKLFLGWIRQLADQEQGNLRLKAEYRV